jgi:hypothetical protein
MGFPPREIFTGARPPLKSRMPVPRHSGDQGGLLTILFAAGFAASVQNFFVRKLCNVDAPTLMFVFVRKTLAISTIGRLTLAENCLHDSGSLIDRNVPAAGQGVFASATRA